MGGGIGHTRDFFWHIGVIMFFTGKKILQKVQWILGRHSGGVFKRIDENRELLELLREKAPALLGSHPWVEGWLKSQDEFLSELATQVPLTELQFSPTPPGQPGHAFPRPWPEQSVNQVSKSWPSKAATPGQIDLTNAVSVGIGKSLLDDTDWLPTPGYFGYPEQVRFTVSRAGTIGIKPVSFAEVLNFIDACGFDRRNNEITLEMVLRGIPFEIDGAEMKFTPITV